MKFIDFIRNKETEEMKPVEPNLYDDLLSIMDTLKISHNDGTGKPWYNDDVISFSLSVYSKYSHIYIHDNISGLGIILNIDSDSSLDWKIASEKCRKEVLTHLHNIIKDTRLLPTRESKFCKNITKVNNGESIKPKEPEMPQYKTITITVSDKLLGSCYGYTNYKIITTDKSIYYVGRLQLYNNLKVNETYNVILSRAEDYIIGIVGDVILDV